MSGGRLKHLQITTPPSLIKSLCNDVGLREIELMVSFHHKHPKSGRSFLVSSGTCVFLESGCQFFSVSPIVCWTVLAVDSVHYCLFFGFLYGDSGFIGCPRNVEDGLCASLIPYGLIIPVVASDTALM